MSSKYVKRSRRGWSRLQRSRAPYTESYMSWSLTARAKHDKRASNLSRTGAHDSTVECKATTVSSARLLRYTHPFLGNTTASHTKNGIALGHTPLWPILCFTLRCSFLRCVVRKASASMKNALSTPSVLFLACIFLILCLFWCVQKFGLQFCYRKKPSDVYGVV